MEWTSSTPPAPENRLVVRTGCRLSDDVIFRCRGHGTERFHAGQSGSSAWKGPWKGPFKDALSWAWKGGKSMDELARNPSKGWPRLVDKMTAEV